MENKSKMNILVVILLIIIIALVIYIVMMQNNATQLQEEENTNRISDETIVAEDEVKNEVKNEIEEEEVVQTDLTAEELKEFDEFLSMNAWIATSYTDIENANLGEIMYGLAEASEEAIEEYRDMFEKDLEVEALKITADEVKELVKENTGKTITDLSSMNPTFRYSEEKDAYYAAGSDTNLFEVTCESGYKTSDDKYVIKYKELHSDMAKEGIVTLEKKDGNYLFVANEIK